MKEIIETRNKLISDINHGIIRGSLNIAKSTASFLHLVVTKTDWSIAREVLDAVTNEGKLLTEALPLHAPVSNVVQQLLHIIREEYRTAITKTRPAIQTVQRFLEGTRVLKFEEEKYTVSVEGLQEAVIDHIAEYQTELELSAHNISEQATKHIHASDIIMTIGKSAMVEAFLLSKALEGKSQFEVIVVEGAPFCEGHTLAANLANKGIPTTLVPDSSIFALMPRVNKVILGTNLVLGNGGLRAVTGTHTTALAAKHHSVPVIVLAPSYKFSPRYSNDVRLCDQTSFNLHVSPQGILSYSSGELSSKVHVHNPMFEYVPPEYVTLLISNVGGYESSFVYLVLRELYGTTDNTTGGFSSII